MAVDTTVTINPAMDKAVDLIDQLAVKFGVAGSQLWDIMVSQATVQAVTILFYFLIAVVTGMFIPKYWVKADELEANDVTRNSSKHIGMVVFTCALIIVCVISLLYSVFNIDTVITCFTNPEYWAFNKIMGSLPK